MRLSDLPSHDEVLAAALEDPEFRAQWERTAIGRAVARRVVAYRAQHRLSQTALARLLGMRQPAVARLETGEHNPTLETLMRLSSVLGLEFLIDVTPTSQRRRLASPRATTAEVVEEIGPEEGQVFVAVS